MLTVADELQLDLDAIRRRRESIGMSLDQAATAAGFSTRQQWYLIESGRRANITISTLGRLARALQCSPDDLLK